MSADSSPPRLSPPTWMRWLLLVLGCVIANRALNAIHMPAGGFIGPMAVSITYGVMVGGLKLPRIGFKFSQGVIGVLIAQTLTLSVLFKILDDNLTNEDVTIRLNTRAVRLLTSDDAREVRGITVEGTDGISRIKARRSVILASGCLEYSGRSGPRQPTAHHRRVWRSNPEVVRRRRAGQLIRPPLHVGRKHR